MANFGIKIDLLKIKGAFMKNVQGRTQTKRCIIIPVDDDPGIYLGEKCCYLSMVAVELQNPKYEDTHMVKSDIPKDVRELLTEEQRRELPILGNMRPLKSGQQQMQVNGVASFAENEDESLPF